MCYRFLAHSTDDNDMTYRTREEVSEHRKHDPVPRFERLLLEAGVIDDADVDAISSKDVLRETNEATDSAEAMPYPDRHRTSIRTLRRSLASRGSSTAEHRRC